MLGCPDRDHRCRSVLIRLGGEQKCRLDRSEEQEEQQRQDERHFDERLPTTWLHASRRQGEQIVTERHRASLHARTARV
jgi:hypothetical protein